MFFDKVYYLFQWLANPVNDMYADAVLTAILQAETVDPPKKQLNLPTKIDRMHFKVPISLLLCFIVPFVLNITFITIFLQECLIEMLQEMFGEDSVPKMFKGESMFVTVDGKKANIDLVDLVSFL